MRSDDLGFHRFISATHPERVRYGVFVSQLGVRAFSFLAVPVMVWALFEALDGVAPLRPFLIGVCIAAAVAAVYVHFTARAEISEITLHGRFIAVRSSAEVARGVPLTFVPLFEARREGDRIVLASGDRSLEIRLSDWPDSAALLGAINAALTLDFQSTPSAAPAP